MKIRILGNSIRMRLSQTDMSELEKKGERIEQVDFGSSRFEYGIKIEEGDISASFAHGRMVVSIPHELANPWISTEQVGIEKTLVQPNAPEMKILLEKDFACLVPRAGEGDLYANPMADNKE